MCLRWVLDPQLPGLKAKSSPIPGDDHSSTSDLNPAQQSLQVLAGSTQHPLRGDCTLRCAPVGISSEGLAENFVAIH